MKQQIEKVIAAGQLETKNPAEKPVKKKRKYLL